MGYSQGQVVSWFADGITNKNASNLYSKGNALYSYGRHFPLAIRHNAETSLKHREDWFLLNGDRYSSTTSQHQSKTFSKFQNHPRVSFNALNAAGIDPFSDNLILVDYQTDEYQENFITEDGAAANYQGYNVSRADFRARIPFGAVYSEHKCTYALSTDGKPMIKQYLHKIGGALFQYDGEYFLCAMDEGSYFVAQLAHPVNSIDAAVEDLKPNLIKSLPKDTDVKRQGEWFFIPTELKEGKEFILAKGFRLPRPNDRGNVHQPAAGFPVTYEGEQVYLVRGMIRHISSSPWGSRATGEHRPLRLGSVLHIAVRNTEKASWSGGGRVD
jgi:hypothetical protein